MEERRPDEALERLGPRTPYRGVARISGTDVVRIPGNQQASRPGKIDKK
jgi:hypothetical protein